MSLYDGLGLDSKEKIQRDQKSDIMGWSSGIKLLQSQLQLKKAALTQAKRDNVRKGSSAVLAPVVDLKSRRDDQEEMPPPPVISYGQKESKSSSNASLLGGDWDVRQEYDPVWPNDYEKIMRDRAEREKRSRDRERDREKDRDRDRDRDIDRDRDDDKPSRRSEGRDRYNRRERYERPPRELERNRDEEFEEERHSRRAPNPGAAIAPPPSLLESVDKKDSPSAPPPAFATGSSVAARIMAKYGFKEGQGLGKKEQGMSQALQVEKTSKRGGKIIHEKDLAKESLPPSPPLPPPPPPPPPSVPAMQSPPSSSQVDSITEIMKNPSKVVLLRNMVGPGEVDEELEPETKEECGKYGDVVKCLIFEIPGGNVPDDEAVRIFIEFKRLESAIKAVVDLNGRYFGGRVVKASFYNTDKFKRLELV